MKHFIELNNDYIALCDLLKLTGEVPSGGAGKHMVASGVILVDGVVETRKTCKIRAGQCVQGPDFDITVQAASQKI